MHVFQNLRFENKHGQPHVVVHQQHDGENIPGQDFLQIAAIKWKQKA